MIPSLSLRALGITVDDPRTVARVAIATGFPGAHLHVHKSPDLRREELDGIAVTWVYPVGPHLDPARQGSALGDFTGWAACAADLGVTTVSTWLPSDQGDGLPLLRALRPLADRARDQGLTLAVELESWWAGGELLPAALDGVRFLGPNAGVALDAAELSTDGVLTALEERAIPVCDVHVSASSATGRSMAGLGSDPASSRLVAALANGGYQGPVLAETFSEAGEPSVPAGLRARRELSALLDPILKGTASG